MFGPNSPFETDTFANQELPWYYPRERLEGK
jgi:hypothetical protein